MGILVIIIIILLLSGSSSGSSSSKSSTGSGSSGSTSSNPSPPDKPEQSVTSPFPDYAETKSAYKAAVDIYPRMCMYSTIPKFAMGEEEQQLCDEQIRRCFYDMLSNAQQEIFIVSPWINERVTDQVLPVLKKAAARGVGIHIIYGIYTSYGYDDSRSRVSKEQIQRYKRELGNALTVKEDNTHVKVCICDNLYLIGSYNFLSFDGRYTANTWHELCSYGRNTKKLQLLKQKCFNVC